MDSRDLSLKLFVVLNRATNAVLRHNDASVGRHGFSAAEFAILEVLYVRGPLLLGEVQKKILVSSGGVTYLVDRLQAQGLVERQECPTDRRARYAALTDKGRKLIAAIFPGHADALHAALGGLTAEEKEAAIALLRNLGRHAAEHVPDAQVADRTG